jgi:N-acetylmuramic acid 6-phosphate etherase|tara:strand:+ start:8489 stop:9394 length:906 start_codon:yes stop_codon:yes gene_type:complete
MGQEKVMLAPTERADPSLKGFDQLAPRDQLALLLDSQARAITSVAERIPEIACAVDAAVARLRGSSGRLIYAGAGCSIRIGVQDGVELVPTFGWPLSRLGYLIAGGSAALSISIEGAEDDILDSKRQVVELDIDSDDVVIGIAASGYTPFTCGVLEASRNAGALTLAVTSSPFSALCSAAEHPLVTETGAEVLAGSTRLAAGTAQKALLNAFSTTLMTSLGRVLGNEMICVQASNAKLKNRQSRILSGQVASLSHSDAYVLLESLGWDLRLGLLIASGWNPEAARQALQAEHPFRELLKGR